jgi:hypothetical protein
MFDDPRARTDRRAQRRSVTQGVDEKRRQGDRRVFRETQTSKPWWLMRRYVSVEKFLGDRGF